jgi:hypothetical protein
MPLLTVLRSVDYDALLEWANKNSAMKWRTELLPDDATLSS